MFEFTREEPHREWIEHDEVAIVKYFSESIGFDIFVFFERRSYKRFRKPGRKCLNDSVSSLSYFDGIFVADEGEYFACMVRCILLFVFD